MPDTNELNAKKPQDQTVAQPERDADQREVDAGANEEGSGPNGRATPKPDQARGAIEPTTNTKAKEKATEAQEAITKARADLKEAGDTLDKALDDEAPKADLIKASKASNASADRAIKTAKKATDLAVEAQKLEPTDPNVAADVAAALDAARRVTSEAKTAKADAEVALKSAELRE